MSPILISQRVAGGAKRTSNVDRTLDTDWTLDRTQRPWSSPCLRLRNRPAGHFIGALNPLYRSSSAASWAKQCQFMILPTYKQTTFLMAGTNPCCWQHLHGPSCPACTFQLRVKCRVWNKRSEWWQSCSCSMHEVALSIASNIHLHPVLWSTGVSALLSSESEPVTLFFILRI